MQRLIVKRVSDNQNGIETKKWKKYQCVCCALRGETCAHNMCRFQETLRDPKTWLYFLFATVS